MGVHIVGDEREMFFSHEPVSNTSNDTLNSLGATSFRSLDGSTLPFRWEGEHGKPVPVCSSWKAAEPRFAPGNPPAPPESRPTCSGSPLCHNFSRLSISNGLRPHQATADYQSHHSQFASPALILKKTVANTRGLSSTSTANITAAIHVDGLKMMRKRGKVPSESLDKHFGYYEHDALRYENESMSSSSNLDNAHETSIASSPNVTFYQEFQAFYPTTPVHATIHLPPSKQPAARKGAGPCGPSSQPVQKSFLNFATMVDDDTNEDDIIFDSHAHPTRDIQLKTERTTGVSNNFDYLEETLPGLRESPGSTHSSLTRDLGDPQLWQNSTRMRGNAEKHGSSSPTVIHERWSSNGNSWNLSLVQKPREEVPRLWNLSKTPKPPTMTKGQSSRGMCAAPMAREVHAAGSMMAYNRSGDMYGRHKWERDSSGSLPSVGELGFEAYDRVEEVVDTVDEEDFPFSPIASSFVFGENNSSVEFSQVRGRLPKAVGPLIVHEFSIPQFGLQESRRNSTSNSSTSNDMMSSLAPYSWEPGDQEPEQRQKRQQQQQRIPTRAFHHHHQYINKAPPHANDLAYSSGIFRGYSEFNNGSGRFRIELQRGPKLERHRNTSGRLQNNKTPEVLIRLVEEAAANMRSQQQQQQRKKNSRSKNSCTQCTCLPVLRKGLLAQCLSLNQRPGCAMVNSFEARLGTVDEQVVMREAPNFEVMREAPNYFNMREVPNLKGKTTSNFKLKWEGPNSDMRGDGQNFKMSLTHSEEVTRDALNFLNR